MLAQDLSLEPYLELEAKKFPYSLRDEGTTAEGASPPMS